MKSKCQSDSHCNKVFKINLCKCQLSLFWIFFVKKLLKFYIYAVNNILSQKIKKENCEFEKKKKNNVNKKIANSKMKNKK